MVGKFVWNNIILGIVVNVFIAPFAYWFRNYANKNKGFLGTFLNSDNTYGDVDWRPKLKNKFLRAYLWMLRNPRQNWYGKDYVDGIESDFKGSGKVKFGNNILSWRTMICSDTGNWHGKILDFNSDRGGKQDITFKRTDINGKVQNCFRKSTCIPYRIGPIILLMKRRSGHELGLLQYNLSFPIFNYKKNKDGGKIGKSKEGKTINL